MKTIFVCFFILFIITMCCIHFLIQNSKEKCADNHLYCHGIRSVYWWAKTDTLKIDIVVICCTVWIGSVNAAAHSLLAGHRDLGVLWATVNFPQTPELFIKLKCLVNNFRLKWNDTLCVYLLFAIWELLLNSGYALLWMQPKCFQSTVSQS